LRPHVTNPIQYACCAKRDYSPNVHGSSGERTQNSSCRATHYIDLLHQRDAIWVHCRQASNTANSHCGKGMVFAINCGQDGAPNSFTNFKNAALAIGASLAGTTPTSTYAYAPTAAPSGSQVTATITLASSTWTTTYTSYPGSPDPTPSSLTGNIIKVVVGGPGKLAFDPPHVPAKPRDIVRFELFVIHTFVNPSPSVLSLIPAMSRTIPSRNHPLVLLAFG